MSRLEILKKRARFMSRTLGMRCAAGFLRNRDIPFEDAYEILLGRKPRLV